jgi:hypothetical protein
LVPHADAIAASANSSDKEAARVRVEGSNPILHPYAGVKLGLL